MLFTGNDNSLDVFLDENEDTNLHLALNYSKDLISIHNKNGIFTYVSPSTTSMLGYSQHELHKTSLFTFCHPIDKEKLKKRFEQYAQSGDERIRFRFRRKEGDYIWLEMNCSSINNGQQMICISRDITEQMTTEEEILETQEKYRLLVEFSKDTIGMMTEKGVWTYINDEGKKLLGFTSSNEIVGTSLYDYISPSDHTVLRNFLNAKQSINFEKNLTRSDGDMRKVEIQLIPTVFKNRKIFQIIIKDITGQKKTEEQLQNAEKLSIVGQLAASIAHEIRNPLTAIKGFAQFLTEDKSSHYGEVILNELERIEGIVNDLLVLAKPESNNLQQVNLINVVKSVVVLLNSEALISNITIDVKHDQSELIISCEIDKIKQVIINVLKNSIEAMPEGGQIIVSVKKDRNFALIRVQDEGVGIPEERLSKIGEPFFSTKEKGTGLGLMICNRIIKNHGGNLHIKSKENEGTTLIILLPLYEK
ncbi:PAS domain S-box protein [Peribacillus cavernae]|uniref:PAS domain S-box protein n=1 Tax=Peribacillus cavernae TaxID=1674310 RepID=UPI001FE2D379|nr:PAS domain S-box protein [Peribacillus cavernae]MDQ0218457.1 two-component system sporulation sensor kinase A [Peribacillus cavernae]